MSQPCPKCGSLNLAGHRYCSNCGTALQPTSQPQPAPVSSSEQTQEGTLPLYTSSAAPAGQQPGPESDLARPASPSFVVKTSEPAPPYQDAPVTSRPAGQPSAAPSYFSPPPPTGQPSVPPSNTGYQGYPPGASGRASGATYAPYVSSTATRLEKPSESRSWLMPVIVVAALVLLALAVVSALLVMNNPTTVSLPNTSIAGEKATPGASIPAAVSTPSIRTTPLPAGAGEEDQVRQAIMKSNENQIIAWQKVDEEVIKLVYTGAALEEQIEMIRELKRSGFYAIPVNHRLDITDIKIEGDTATAKTLEEWTVTFYDVSTNKRVEAKGPDVWDETYHLVKKDGNWMIEKLEFKPHKGPTPQGTPGEY